MYIVQIIILQQEAPRILIIIKNYYFFSEAIRINGEFQGFSRSCITYGSECLNDGQEKIEDYLFELNVLFFNMCIK